MREMTCDGGLAGTVETEEDDKTSPRIAAALSSFRKAGSAENRGDKLDEAI